MKPKNFFKGITTALFSGFLLYNLNTSELKAQSNAQSSDSSVVTGYIYVLEFDGHRIRHLTKAWNDVQAALI